MLRSTNIILHIAVFIAVLIFGHYDLVDILLIFETQIVVLAVTHFALVQASKNRGTAAGALTVGFILFFWVGYLSKLGLGMFIADQYWVVPKLLNTKQLLAQLPVAFFMSSVGFVCLLAGILTFPLRQTLTWEVSKAITRDRLILTILPFALMVKYILKSKYNLGVPGYDAEYLGIPYLAGFLTLVISNGFLVLANVPLFFALSKGRRLYAIIALSLALANAAIDLMFGTKSAIMYQIVITLVYILLFRKGKTGKTSQMVLVLIVIVGGITAVFYKYLNFFRFALLAGTTNTSAAISEALQNDVAISRSSWVELYNRITGLETVAALREIAQDFSVDFSLLSLVDGSVAQKFTVYFMGTGDTKTLFAVTQFGYYYLVGGFLALVLGSYTLGIVFSYLQYLVLRMNVHYNMKIAFFPILWILYVQFLGGGGNFILWSKQMIAVMLVFYLAAFSLVEVPTKPKS